MLKVERLETSLTAHLRYHEHRMGRVEHHIDMLAQRPTGRIPWAMILKVGGVILLMVLGSMGLITWPNVAQNAGTLL